MKQQFAWIDDDGEGINIVVNIVVMSMVPE